MDRTLSVVFVVMCAAALAACQSPQIQQDVAQNTRADTWNGQKALLEDNCIMREWTPTPHETGGSGNVLLTVAPTLITKSLELLTDYFQQKKSAFTAITEYKTAGALYAEEGTEIRPGFRCLVLVKGDFGPNDAGDTLRNPDSACPPRRETVEKWDSCRLQKLSLQRVPEFYAEFAVAFLNEGTSMALVPVFLDYAASDAHPGVGSKDLLFAITLSGQLEEESETRVRTFATFTLKLANVRIGSRLADAGALSGLTTEYRALPRPRTVQVENGSLTDVVPVEVLVLVTETEEAGDFYVKAAEAVEAVKKPLSEQATEWLKEVLSAKH